MLVLKWKERAFIEKVNSRCFCWFPAAILVHQNGRPMRRLHTKLYKGAWNVSANNWETLGHKDMRLGQIVYVLVCYNISFSWLLPLDGFQFIFLLRDCENDLLVSVCRISLTISFLIGRKRTVNFRNPRLQDRFLKYLGHKHPLWLPEAFTKHNKKFDLKLFSHHVKPGLIRPVKNRSNYANQPNIMEGSRDKRQTAISGQRTAPK